jgi:hypothetical protein
MLAYVVFKVAHRLPKPYPIIIALSAAIFFYALISLWVLVHNKMNEVSNTQTRSADKEMVVQPTPTAVPVRRARLVKLPHHHKLADQ